MSYSDISMRIYMPDDDPVPSDARLKEIRDAINPDLNPDVINELFRKIEALKGEVEYEKAAHERHSQLNGEWTIKYDALAERVKRLREALGNADCNCNRRGSRIRCVVCEALVEDDKAVKG